MVPSKDTQIDSSIFSEIVSIAKSVLRVGGERMKRAQEVDIGVLLTKWDRPLLKSNQRWRRHGKTKGKRLSISEMNRLYCLECAEGKGILITVLEGSRARARYLHSIDALGSSVSGYDDTSSYHSPANAADPPAASPHSTATSGPAPAAAGTHASAGNLFLPQCSSSKRTASSGTRLFRPRMPYHQTFSCMGVGGSTLSIPAPLLITTPPPSSFLV